MPLSIDHVLVGGSGFIARHLRTKLSGKVLILDKKVPDNLSEGEFYSSIDIRQELTDLGNFVFTKHTVIHQVYC